LAQVPAPMRRVPEQLGLPQVTAGYEQVPLAPQTPAQAVTVPAQSELVQQLVAGIQADPHALKPVAQVEQIPAPVQVVFAGQAMGAGRRQVPLAQVPAPMRRVPEQLGLPQVAAGYEQVPLAPQTPAQAVTVPAQSALVQQLVAGIQADPHALKPAAHTKVHVRVVVLQTPAEFAGPPTQSALVQHDACEMQAVPHALKPELQV
jgi:hypothetical protein